MISNMILVKTSQWTSEPIDPFNFFPWGIQETWMWIFHWDHLTCIPVFFTRDGEKKRGGYRKEKEEQKKKIVNIFLPILYRLYLSVVIWLLFSSITVANCIPTTCCCCVCGVIRLNVSPYLHREHILWWSFGVLKVVRIRRKAREAMLQDKEAYREACLYRTLTY